MKHIISLLTLIIIATACYAHQLEVEVVWLDTMHSDHTNNCDPECANQNNGGRGLAIRYKSDEKHLDVAIGQIYLVNSHGDPGRVDFLQLDRAEYANKFIRASLAIWIMDIYGYKDNSGDSIVVSPGPWPKFQIGLNPFWLLSENVYINYNMIYFPLVKIDWISATYIWRF